jgi:hypothetical protein
MDSIGTIPLAGVRRAVVMRLSEPERLREALPDVGQVIVPLLERLIGRRQVPLRALLHEGHAERLARGRSHGHPSIDMGSASAFAAAHDIDRASRLRLARPLAHIGQRRLAPTGAELPLQQEIRRFTIEARLGMAVIACSKRARSSGAGGAARCALGARTIEHGSTRTW